MHDTPNDERLKILQERLAHIKEKRENSTSQSSQRKEITEGSTPKVEKSGEKKEPSWGLEEEKKKSHTIKYFIFLICVGLGVYAYTNMDSLFSATEEVAEEETPFILNYNFEIEGNQLAIINSFEDESSAKAMVNDLTVKGFKCDYFFLPEKSNSTENIYEVFLGPFENEEETSQWIQNIEKEVTIINLFTGSVLGIMKSNKLKEKEKLEREKTAKEEAKKEKIAKEKAEKERITREKNKKEQIAKEKAESDKIAREEAEKKRSKERWEENENEKENLKKEIDKLEKEKRILLSTRTTNTEIKISYEYDWLSNKEEDEGVLTISNNAGYPNIKIAYANVESQGGKIEIINKMKDSMDNKGVSLKGIDFSKTGTLVEFYDGEISTVIW